MMIVKSLGLALLASALYAPLASASEVDVLEDVLSDFLATTHQQSAHQRFWADDLIYTSSDGSRFGKATILSGFDGSEATDEAPQTVYSAEDIDIRLFEDVAIVAFKLVGTPKDGSRVLYYFNTGTFQKRDGQWRAIAWQATVIPSEE